jgi:hypothetical protein
VYSFLFKVAIPVKIYQRIPGTFAATNVYPCLYNDRIFDWALEENSLQEDRRGKLSSENRRNLGVVINYTHTYIYIHISDRSWNSRHKYSIETLSVAMALKHWKNAWDPNVK